LLGAAAVGQTPLDPLPDGTYEYKIIESGKPLASSTIRVSRSSDLLVIEEHSSPMEATEWSRRTLDPSTFATRSFADDSDGNRIATLTIDGDTATLQQHDVLRNGVSTTKLSAPRGAPFAGVLDLNVGFFFHLPATLHVMRTATLTMAVYGFKNYAAPLLVSAGTAKQPEGVVKSSAGFAVRVDKANCTLWYDPRTFVLNELDCPAQRIVFKREG
jgi:hypothetical protein